MVHSLTRVLFSAMRAIFIPPRKSIFYSHVHYQFDKASYKTHTGRHDIPEPPLSSKK